MAMTAERKNRVAFAVALEKWRNHMATDKRTKQTMIVISLPSGGEGDALKEALQKMSNENSRSMSNQAMIILREFLLKEGRL